MSFIYLQMTENLENLDQASIILSLEDIIVIIF
jgi:hypothetical protein